MDVFKLSRNWFNFCFENPELITPNHSAMYFFIIEHCNRLGWKEKFGLPMEMTKDAIGIKNYRTYSKTFKDLEEWGFVKVIQRSKNQYSSNIIAIVENAKASTKALDKAMIRHSQKQDEKQYNGIVCIDIQETINNKQETIIDIPKKIIPTIDEIKNYCIERKNKVDPEKWFNFYQSKGWMIGKNKMKDWKAAIRTWEKNVTHIDNANQQQRNFEPKSAVGKNEQFIIDHANGLHGIANAEIPEF